MFYVALKITGKYFFLLQGCRWLAPLPKSSASMQPSCPSWSIGCLTDGCRKKLCPGRPVPAISTRPSPTSTSSRTSGTERTVRARPMTSRKRTRPTSWDASTCCKAASALITLFRFVSVCTDCSVNNREGKDIFCVSPKFVQSTLSLTKESSRILYNSWSDPNEVAWINDTLFEQPHVFYTKPKEIIHGAKKWMMSGRAKKWIKEGEGKQPLDWIYNVKT